LERNAVALYVGSAGIPTLPRFIHKRLLASELGFCDGLGRAGSVEFFYNPLPLWERCYRVERKL